MDTSFGESWQAVVVTLELDRLMSGGAGGFGYIAALTIILAGIGVVGYVAIQAWRRRPG